VIALDVLRALVRNPTSLDAFVAELEQASGVDRRLDGFVTALKEDLSDAEALEFRARGLVERMALALQGSLLTRHGHPAVADAFCASRLGGDWGRAFGTLAAGTDFASIIDRHRPNVD
jgi:putative acyl-CoA dehydrogenase